MGDSSDDLRLRRDALQIVLQLPEDQSEALQVLAYAEVLVKGFMAGRDDGNPPKPPAPPLPFRVV